MVTSISLPMQGARSLLLTPHAKPRSFTRSSDDATMSRIFSLVDAIGCVTNNLRPSRAPPTNARRTLRFLMLSSLFISRLMVSTIILAVCGG